MRLARLLPLILFSAALRADAPPADPPAAPAEAAIPAPDALLVDGPASVSLGAEALLNLPAGWRFVPVSQLKAYWRAQAKPVGAWDRGVVLPGGTLELRLLFEPMGAVATEALPQPEPLLQRAQALARDAAARPQASGDALRELAFWRWEPFFDPQAQSLRFGGVWRLQADESVSLHVRWLGRRGVLKLDWRGAEDDANAFSAAAEQLEDGLRFQPGQARVDAGPGDPKASLDLSGLVLDGLFGRAAARPGGEPPQAWPWWAWLALVLALAAALVAALLAAWRRLEAWLDRRQRERKEAARLDHLERTLGGKASDVELLEED